MGKKILKANQRNVDPVALFLICLFFPLKEKTSGKYKTATKHLFEEELDSLKCSVSDSVPVQIGPLV